jgi:undecaprenyl-diphosphatase
LGDSWLWLAICGLMLTIAQRGAQTHRGKRLTAALSLLAVMVATAAVVATVKQLVKRKRPRTASFLYGAGVDVHSFPSGHAARLAAIAIWLGGVFPGWGRQLWLLAFLVGFSRVHLGIHYIGDVIAGFAVGGFTGWLLRQVWRNKTANR